MQIKKIPSRIWVNDYIIKFKYVTKRNNFKEQSRVISQIDKNMAARDFWIYIQNFNEKMPYRAMLNVEILSVVENNGRFIGI